MLGLSLSLSLYIYASGMQFTALLLQNAKHESVEKAMQTTGSILHFWATATSRLPTLPVVVAIRSLHRIWLRRMGASLAHYCHPSIWWTRSIVLNLVFRVRVLLLCATDSSDYRSVNLLADACSSWQWYGGDETQSILFDYGELPPLQANCHMTVKMASGTIFWGVLHFFLVAVVLVSFANSMSSVLPLVLNTWPCTDATEEKGQFYTVSS